VEGRDSRCSSEPVSFNRSCVEISFEQICSQLLLTDHGAVYIYLPKKSNLKLH